MCIASAHHCVIITTPEALVVLYPVSALSDSSSTSSSQYCAGRHTIERLKATTKIPMRNKLSCLFIFRATNLTKQLSLQKHLASINNDPCLGKSVEVHTLLMLYFLQNIPLFLWKIWTTMYVNRLNKETLKVHTKRFPIMYKD